MLFSSPRMATFGDAARLIAGTCIALNESAVGVSASKTREALRDIIEEILGVDRSRIAPTARFVEDLGLN